MEKHCRITSTLQFNEVNLSRLFRSGSEEDELLPGSFESCLARESRLSMYVDSPLSDLNGKEPSPITAGSGWDP
jgi:hypothetical protein